MPCWSVLFSIFHFSYILNSYNEVILSREVDGPKQISTHQQPSSRMRQLFEREKSSCRLKISCNLLLEKHTISTYCHSDGFVAMLIITMFPGWRLLFVKSCVFVGRRNPALYEYNKLSHFTQINREAATMLSRCAGHATYLCEFRATYWTLKNPFESFQLPGIIKALFLIFIRIFSCCFVCLVVRTIAPTRIIWSLPFMLKCVVYERATSVREASNRSSSTAKKWQW